MASDNSNDYGNETNISDLFDNAFELFKNILKQTDESTNSLKVQLNVKKCMSMLEDATKLVSMADMFSANEDFDEIPTENVKYFLLPALLGTLATKLCDRDNRLHNVEVSEVYFYDFLERIKSYNIINFEIPKRKDENVVEDDTNASTSTTTTKHTAQSNKQMIEQMVHTRQNKLQRYKEQKELQEKLQTLQKCMDSLNIDDESKRDYFVTCIKSYALEALDEINSLAQEKEILIHMSQLTGREIEGGRKTKEQNTTKLQPIIITKNAAQKAVFGAGYPSLPVMTVDEFYEKKVADGEWAAGGPGQTDAGGQCLMDMTSTEDTPRQEDPDDVKKEEQIEQDDDEYLAQARAMDEYKDTHKRGWGNRYNRS
ncbi:hypothetical protein PV325_007183 [Microctonus aethiopoides]|uniref:Immunoglobulin-binding protein 1 n=1 Tax=Microctonus aethiopoides TaxID=144406 RepID=A0AA39FAD6_9HYME|nr:hypothetical protein PV325_007183 [Microctonus aethiopoides]KAK0092670.1 hypothetical protein PV326_000892 [Microctonus aethiopoides]KAK0165903.1 hypothetical protein PV328_004382 [Microctonus aethiopoides]